MPPTETAQSQPLFSVAEVIQMLADEAATTVCTPSDVPGVWKHRGDMAGLAVKLQHTRLKLADAANHEASRDMKEVRLTIRSAHHDATFETGWIAARVAAIDTIYIGPARRIAGFLEAVHAQLDKRRPVKP